MRDATSLNLITDDEETIIDALDAMDECAKVVLQVSLLDEEGVDPFDIPALDVIALGGNWYSVRCYHPASTCINDYDPVAVRHESAVIAAATLWRDQILHAGLR